MTRYLRMWIHDNRLVSPETGRLVTSVWGTSPVTFVNTPVFYFCGCIGWLCPCRTRRFVTSVWDTSVGYFRTENYSGLLFSTFMLVSSVRWHGYLWTSGWLLPCVPRFITSRTGCLRLWTRQLVTSMTTSTGHAGVLGHAGWLLPSIRLS